MKKVYRMTTSNGLKTSKYSIRKKGNTYVWRKEGGMKSKKYNLNKKDMKDVGVMALFAGGSAIALFLVDSVLPQLDFGRYAPYITPLLPVVTYGVRKWAKGA